MVAGFWLQHVLLGCLAGGQAIKKTSIACSAKTKTPAGAAKAPLLPCLWAPPPRQLENELRRLLGSVRCATLGPGRAELEIAAARYAVSDALLSLAEVAAPDDEDLAYQMAVGGFIPS